MVSERYSHCECRRVGRYVPQCTRASVNEFTEHVVARLIHAACSQVAETFEVALENR